MADDVTQFARWRAFAIHLLTASGAFFAFMALIAAAERRWVGVFAWLGLALFIDGIDGPLARKIDVKRLLPNWSGDLLDSIIDYATFVMIPAVALYLSGLIGEPLSGVAAGLIVVSAAVYYADTRMKTKDNFFRGFPVAWNMLVFALFAIRPPEWVAFGFVVLCAALTFLPIKFLHPVRVARLRGLNLAIVAAWSVLGLVALLADFDTPEWARWGLAATSLYLFAIGGILQLADRLSGGAHRRDID
ncbi:phosphatidylcholine synthase [Aurantimonas sp. VKM B-3413]|uniref:phosphatidylcholine synthase n=1 Tax=Aurantimonas sp. VKM B-3413 TaxID=2779401 RepID=UPI001E3D63DB|nr:phosphatidylcholine/phosphatidylserine synthase [Aurantimonas sp. VKM B-3413]MCB8837112.1 phosphatidylcholine/phosphatidylserine synthase [Aurantimonas sp. VKM B-3413]